MTNSIACSCIDIKNELAGLTIADHVRDDAHRPPNARAIDLVLNEAETSVNNRTALRLAEDAAVAAYDVSGGAIAALRSAQATAPGLKAIAAEARDLVRRPVLVAELKRVQAAVIDPPRAGAAEQHRELAGSGLARIASVSCNPATFARDARILTDGGFTLVRVLPVDQFLWSPHVELVGVFERSRG